MTNAGLVPGPILDDGAQEPAETVNLALTSPTGGASLGSPAAAVLTIVDNDTSGSTISGFIRDLNGTGVAGVSVALTGAQHGMATTDAGGRYSFTLLVPGGPSTVTPSKAGFTFNPPSASVASGALGADFVVTTGVFTRYFAEGATGPFFDMALALVNATTVSANVTVRYLRADGNLITQAVVVNSAAGVSLRRRATARDPPSERLCRLDMLAAIYARTSTDQNSVATRRSR